jgi:Icc protein
MKYLEPSSSLSIDSTPAPANDGVDRRGFLRCMAWAGTGVLWTASGGLLRSAVLARAEGTAGDSAPAATFNFVQISDSHIGFNKEANQDVVGTLKTAIAKINALPARPDFILHTGDLTHLSEPEEFDTLQQLLHGTPVFYVPGEHDVLNDNGKQYLERFGKGTRGSGWFSFNHKGVHFVGLVNVTNIAEGGLGVLGEDQLKWLKQDLEPLGASTPIVLFAHIPLWAIFPKWGWGTQDSERALGYLKRFGSVTILNGHIHQTLRKVEGTVTFHTAMSTAFPQPAPGSAPKPGPMKVASDKLRAVLGITEVNVIQGTQPLAVVDETLD